MGDIEQYIADLIMNRAIYQDREGEGMTAYDRESHEYQYCQNAAGSILAALTAAGYGLVADAKRSLELAALLAYEAVEASTIEQAKADAWDEGYGRGTDLAAWAIGNRPQSERPDTTNPYRKASNDDQ